MQVNPGEGTMTVAAIGVEERPGPVEVNAELRFLLAGRRVAMRLRIDVGVDAQRGLAAAVHPRGDAADILQLPLGLDVEPSHLGLQGQADLGVGLADAGINAALRIDARQPCAVQLTAADEVHAGPALGEGPAHCQVGAALDRVTDQGIQRSERLSEAGIVIGKRRPRIHVTRRPHLLGDGGNGHGLAIQVAILVRKVIHTTPRRESLVRLYRQLAYKCSSPWGGGPKDPWSPWPLSTARSPAKEL